MARVGRPKKEIDWKQFEAQCKLQCTLREIAAYFDCSEDTIETKVREHYKAGFSEVFKRKRQTGLLSLRASLFQLGQKDGRVAVFLAKNWLGMADVQKVDYTNKKGIEELTDEELAAIIEGRRSSQGTAEPSHGA